MPARESKKQLGVRGEDWACAELERQDVRVLERNWRCRPANGQAGRYFMRTQGCAFSG
jgi:hypothetical protein